MNCHHLYNTDHGYINPIIWQGKTANKNALLKQDTSLYFPLEIMEKNIYWCQLLAQLLTTKIYHFVIKCNKGKIEIGIIKMRRYVNTVPVIQTHLLEIIKNHCCFHYLLCSSLSGVIKIKIQPELRLTW